MRNTMLFIALIGLIAQGGLFAQDDFTPRLERELLRRGYAESERAMIMTAVRERTWNGINAADAELAALTLAACERVRTETQARDQVELVYHLAVMNQEMKALGFTEREIARIAFSAARDIEAHWRERTEADNANGRGELIRDRLRSELCSAGLEAQEAKIMERIRSRTQAEWAAGKKRGYPF